ncbi:MAG: hypothetical protein ACF8GE_10905 [Phycisphaerales bacterium JB043]
MRTHTLTRSLALALCVTTLVGCVGYSSYPGLPNDTALNDTNTTAMKQVTLESLRYVSEHRELPDRYTLNLPFGMVAENVAGMVRDLDDPRGVVLSHETADLPVVHVVEIRIRGSRAQVDVASPLPGTTSDSEIIAHEMNTIYLRGGLKRWRVTDARRWSIANASVPEPYFIEDAPTIERPTQVNATNEPD